VVERTNSWHNAHKKLLWCTERQGGVIDFFWVAFSDVIIHSEEADPRSLEPLPLGGPTFSPTMTYWRKL
jgi:hypothetical protein